MSNAVSALQGAAYVGFAQVEEAGLQGMIAVRADLAAPALAKALKEVAGCAVPAQRRIAVEGGRGVGWMSPDELLVLVPHAEAPAAAARLAEALSGEHALVADVSDARVMFRIRGAKAGEVPAKLCPVDFARLAPGELRRTRAAQTAAALWRSGPEEFTLIGFRSTAAYLMGLLEASARPGSELFPGA